MTNKKVYLLTVEWSYDGEDGVEIEVFDDIDLATNYLNKLMKKEREGTWISEISSLGEETDGLSYYYAYDKNNESESRTYINIEEKIVNRCV